MTSNIPLQISAPVSEALDAGRPVVALESTIISHGMPWPDNLDTALGVEQVVREHGAEPATIAVMDGGIRVGLGMSELERLAKADDVRKLSRRDLPHALALGHLGATTVAATMICAHLAGIRIFATGGIGGVHRGAEIDMDISADLEELARTPVTVVCAGAKSILDIPKTLEYLETCGVPVMVHGSDRFPAFFTRDSGEPAPMQVANAAEAARALDMQNRLGYDCGCLIANPIPAQQAASGLEIEKATEQALSEAGQKNIAGKDVTPFLLSRIVELTDGESLTANIALVRNNAALAADIAGKLNTRP